MPEGPEDIGSLTRLFDALGAEDPEGWAESEAEEGLPQLARFRFLRMVWQDIDAWSTTASDWVAAYRRGGAGGGGGRPRGGRCQRREFRVVVMAGILLSQW